MTASSRAVAHLLHSLSCLTGPLGSMVGSALPLPALEVLKSHLDQCCCEMNSQSSLLGPQVMDHPCLLADLKPHRRWTAYLINNKLLIVKYLLLTGFVVQFISIN